MTCLHLPVALQIVAGLQKHISQDELQGSLVVVRTVVCTLHTLSLPVDLAQSGFSRH